MKQFDLKRWLELVQLLMPIIISILDSNLLPLASKVSNGVVEAELTNASGPDKLKSVQNSVGAVANSVYTNLGEKTPSNLNQTVQNAVDMTVAVANLIHNKPSTK